MFTKIKSLFMVLILAGFTAQYAAAESFNQEDMAFAFGDSAIAASDFGQMDLLSSHEMVATEGNVAPLVAIGFLHGGRFIVTRYVSHRVAVKALRSGCNVYCSRASTARNLAVRAYGRNNITRHGPRYGHVNYSHYQSLGRGYRGHAFYGRRWR